MSYIRAMEALASWAVEYSSPEHHDEDEVARVGEFVITVGFLRQARRHYARVLHSSGRVTVLPNLKPDEAVGTP